MEIQKDAQVIEGGCEEFQRIKERYPGRIPIICSQGPNSHFLDLKKNKFLVSHAMKWKEFKNMVAKHAKSSSEHLLRLPLKATVAGLQPAEKISMSDVYKNHKSSDGFLHVTVEGFGDKLGTHNLDHIAHFVTSALSDSSRDHKKLFAMVEQLGNRVIALESSSKKTVAEPKQFEEQVAVVEKVPPQINSPHLSVDALVAKCLETAGKSLSDGLPWLLCISMSFVLMAVTYRLITTPHPGFHNLALANEDALKTPYMEKLQSIWEEEARSSEKLSKVVQMQFSTIQELKNELQLSQQAPSTWTIGSLLCCTLLLAQGMVVMVFCLMEIQKRKLPAILNQFLWMDGTQEGSPQEQKSEPQREQTSKPQQQDTEPEEQFLTADIPKCSSASALTYCEEETKSQRMERTQRDDLKELKREPQQEQKSQQSQHHDAVPAEQVLGADTVPLSSASAFTYHEEETKSEQEIVHYIHIKCPPESPTFEFKQEESKFGNDLLTLVFRASLLPSSKDRLIDCWEARLREWHDLGGGKAPVGLCKVPEAGSIGSDRGSRLSAPALLQKIAQQGHDQMSDGDSISEENATDASHVPSDQIRNMRALFGCLDGRSDSLDLNKTASDISSEDAGLQDDESYVPSEPVKPMVDETQEVRGLENGAPSEVSSVSSSQEWEKVSLTEVMEPHA